MKINTVQLARNSQLKCYGSAVEKMKWANAEIGITIRKIKTVVLIIFFSIVIIVRFLKFAANGLGIGEEGGM